MDSFWSKLLILGIVAAIGLFFIHNVYTPQRSAQEAMADSTQQSVNAVKAGVDETLPIITGSAVKTTAQNNFSGASPKKVIIQKANGAEYTYTTTSNNSTSYSAPATSNQPLDAVVVDGNSYRESLSLQSIRFIEQ